MAHTHKLIDGVKVDLTAEEIAELNALDNAWNNGAFDRSRKDLRDITNGLTTVEEVKSVVFPTKPE